MRLESRLPLLRVRIGLAQQGRPGPDGRDASLDVCGAQGETGVHRTVEADEPDRAAVPPPRLVLVVLDELHRPLLGRSGHRDRPHVGEERVERVESRTQPPLDVVDGVDEPAVELDLPPAEDPDATGYADAGLVVAVDVSAHRQLRLLLARVEQAADLGRVLERVGASPDGAGDRAGLHPVARHPHVDLGRRPDEVLLLAQVEEELVRRGVTGPQPLVEASGRVARSVEHPAGDDLEQVPAGEPFLGLAHDVGVASVHRRRWQRPLRPNGRW